MRHDRLYDVQWRRIKQVSLSYLTTLDSIKHTSPVQVVMGVSVLFLLVCKRYKLDPRRVLDTTDRVLRRAYDVEPMYPRAIDEYLTKELSNVD